MLQVEGKKMSKSLGNFFTVRDLLEGNTPDGMKNPGEVIRFVFLMTHYRSPMDWTAEKARQAERVLEDWFLLLSDSHLHFDDQNWLLYTTHEAYAPDAGVVAALADDLNTPLAISRMHKLSKEGSVESRNAFLGSMILLGLLDCPERVGDFSISGVSWSGSHDPNVEKLVNDLLFQRSEARKVRDFAKADRIRDALTAAGVEIEDTQSGPEWRLVADFDPAKLEALQ
jgi:cysteinyl-tRNA synthetase